MAQRRVKFGREEKPDPRLLDAPANTFGGQRDHHAERL